MKSASLLIFLSFIILGIALSPMSILANGDDLDDHDSDNSGSSNGKSGSGSVEKINVREETKIEFRTSSGERVKIERKVEIEDGKTKIIIKRKTIDAQGNEIEVRIVIERDENGIKKRIKLEGVEGLDINTELEIDDEFEGDESELIAIMSNGKRAKIKIMPDRLVEIVLERLKASNFTMELKEIEDEGELRVIYNVKANKTGRFLGLFKMKVKLEGQIDPETGEFIRMNKPWWAFMVAGENGDQVGKKTSLCHIPPGDPSASHIINVGTPAVNAHLAHGDTLNLVGCGSGGNGEEPPVESTFPQWSDNSTSSTLAGTLIEHSVSWTDDVNLSGYVFSFDNGTGTFVNDSFVEMTGTNNFSIVSKLVSITEGDTIRWKVWANDSSGNANETDVFSYTTTALVEEDTTAPTITINSPENITYNVTGDIDYNITVDEVLDTAFFSLDGGSNFTLDNDSATHYFNLSGNHPTLSNGFHNITFWVNDTAGNANQSTVFFTVNITT